MLSNHAIWNLPMPSYEVMNTSEWCCCWNVCRLLDQPLGQRTQREVCSDQLKSKRCHMSLPFCSLISCHFPLDAFSQWKVAIWVTLRGKFLQLMSEIMHKGSSEDKTVVPTRVIQFLCYNYECLRVLFYLIWTCAWNIICSLLTLPPTPSHIHTHDPVLWGSRNKMSYWQVLGPCESGFEFLLTGSLPFNPSHFLELHQQL